jgi:CTP synthase
MPDFARRKVALFTNVEEKAVIPLADADTIYRIPRMLQQRGLDDIVVDKLQLTCPAADLESWDQVVNAQLSPQQQVNVAMVGKYTDLLDAYKSLNEALIHGGIQTHTQVKVHYIDSETLQQSGTAMLSGMDAILIPGGFGTRGIEGKILAAQFARENRLPFLGICLGMQIAVIEFARHVVKLADANSTEFASDTPHPVIALVTEWVTAEGQVESRSQHSDLGGTMRLGGQPCILMANSLSHKLYGQEQIVERHRHRYEVNGQYVSRLEQAGLMIAGCSADKLLVEIVEIADHPWFIGCQFHPEFTSTPRDGHPLFSGFIQAAVNCSKQSAVTMAED